MITIDELVESFLRWWVANERTWEHDTFDHNLFLYWHDHIHLVNHDLEDQVYSRTSFGKRIRKAVRKQASKGWFGWLTPYARLETRIVSNRKSTGYERRVYSLLLKPDFELHPEAWRRMRDDSL